MIGWVHRLAYVRFALTLVVISVCQLANAEESSSPLLSFRRGSETVKPQENFVRTDASVLQASVSKATAAVPQNQRLLPPASPSYASRSMHDQANRTPVFALPKIDSLSTAVAGLGIVVGLFLACMWMLRKAGPTPTSPLPQEAVAVLGRVPLAARNFAQLMQVGNKLVLVSITPDGVAPITEVTDPAEVQRLLGMCLKNHKSSTTAEFHNVLEKLAQEPTQGFLGNEATIAYANQKR